MTKTGICKSCGYANILNKNIKLGSVSDYDKVNLKNVKLPKGLALEIVQKKLIGTTE